MPICADSTELRQRTRLPPAVAAQCTELPGLEAVTGADLLITVGKVPPDVRCLKGLSSNDLGEGPGETVQKRELSLPEALTAHAFRKACESGLLVQRKTGRDLASSVPNFSAILARMLAWTERPWLLFVGDLKESKGEAVIDGKHTNFSYNAVQGALEAWQDEGGRVTFLSRDSLLAPWVARQLDKLRAPKTEKVLPPRRITRPIIGPESNVKPWRSTLMSFPDMGLELANRVADGNATLTSCLEWITCPDWLEKVSTSRPKGIGVPTVQKWRRWLGLNEDCLQLLVAAVPSGTEPRVEFTEKEK
jgi:hypothetical protein